MTSLSTALMTNTTLSNLNLDCSNKRKDTEIIVVHNKPFDMLFKIGNRIGVKGATSLGKALTINQTLTCLNLGRFQSHNTHDHNCFELIPFDKQVTKLGAMGHQH